MNLEWSSVNPPSCIFPILVSSFHLDLDGIAWLFRLSCRKFAITLSLTTASLSLSLYITYIYIRDLLIHVHIHLFIDIYAFTILYVSHIMVGWFVVVRGCTLIQLIRFPCHFQVCPTHSRFCSSVIKTIILNLPILLSTIRIAARRR